MGRSTCVWELPSGLQVLFSLRSAVAWFLGVKWVAWDVGGVK